MLQNKILAIFLTFTLCLSTVACAPTSEMQTPISTTNINQGQKAVPTRISDGQYPVQQATYNDGDGEYTLMLLNTPPGSAPVYRSTNIQMARLSEEDIKAGKKTYLEVKEGQPVMYLTEDFKIEYVHNVTETQVNPQTGQPQTVIVRQESNFWTPFAGALAGQAIGSLLFTPHYYVPPVYQPGGVMVGYGGYGRTYNDAVSSYQSRYQQPPAAVRNRETLRASRNLRTPGNSPTTRKPANPNQPTGAGYGSSNLRSSGKSSPTRTNRPSSFGSGRSRSLGRTGGRRR